MVANPPATDAATAATSLQAAPMSTPEQVQVLELVTRLGTLMADQRKEVDQLRADLARSRVDDTARIDDFQRRLTLAEAQRALAKVTGTPAEQAPSTTVLPARGAGAIRGSSNAGGGAGCGARLTPARQRRSVIGCRPPRLVWRCSRPSIAPATRVRSCRSHSATRCPVTAA